jgi:hypothetical protein
MLDDAIAGTLLHHPVAWPVSSSRMVFCDDVKSV